MRMRTRGHAFGQAVGLDHVHLEGQAAGLEGVAQVGTLGPGQSPGLDEQQLEVLERTRTPGGARPEHGHSGARHDASSYAWLVVLRNSRQMRHAVGRARALNQIAAQAAQTKLVAELE